MPRHALIPDAFRVIALSDTSPVLPRIPTPRLPGLLWAALGLPLAQLPKLILSRKSMRCLTRCLVCPCASFRSLLSVSKCPSLRSLRLKRLHVAPEALHHAFSAHSASPGPDRALWKAQKTKKSPRHFVFRALRWSCAHISLPARHPRISRYFITFRITY